MDEKSERLRNQKLIELFKQMTEEYLIIEEDNKCAWINRLKGIYFEGDKCTFRHSYAAIAEEMYKDWTSEKASLFNENFITLYDLIGDNNEEDKELKKRFRKLKDHIELEGIHLAKLEKMGISAADFEEEKKQYEIAINNFEKKADELKKSCDSIEASKKEVREDLRNNTVQSITLLSIFAGVVFAFSGGFSLLGNAFGNLHQISKEQSLFFMAVVCIIGAILFDVIYLLLNEVGKYPGNNRPRLQGMMRAVNWVCCGAAVVLMGVYWLITPKTSHTDSVIKIESTTIQQSQPQLEGNEGVATPSELTGD